MDIKKFKLWQLAAIFLFIVFIMQVAIGVWSGLSNHESVEQDSFDKSKYTQDERDRLNEDKPIPCNGEDVYKGTCNKERSKCYYDLDGIIQCPRIDDVKEGHWECIEYDRTGSYSTFNYQTFCTKQALVRVLE